MDTRYVWFVGCPICCNTCCAIFSKLLHPTQSRLYTSSLTHSLICYDLLSDRWSVWFLKWLCKMWDLDLWLRLKTLTLAVHHNHFWDEWISLWVYKLYWTADRWYVPLKRLQSMFKQIVNPKCQLYVFRCAYTCISLTK